MVKKNQHRAAKRAIAEMSETQSLGFARATRFIVDKLFSLKAFKRKDGDLSEKLAQGTWRAYR